MTSGPHDLDPDPPPTAQQLAQIRALTEKQLDRIDVVLHSNVKEQWRKVAMIVALTIEELENECPGIPDVYYAQRLKLLVGSGRLESLGDLSRMRYSEVRRPAVKV
jgi:hypothetical protein